MSSGIHDDNQPNNSLPVGMSIHFADPTAEMLAARPTLLLLVPCLIAGIWLLISH
tara:strand:+ start:203870 stop:204034 length:165 start_codon:yes stop_codon:yes gene_type:complete